MHAYYRPYRYKKHQIEILKQNIRGKMRKKYGRKVQTHSKSHRRMQKVGKVWRKCKKNTLDHTRGCTLINACLLIHAY